MFCVGGASRERERHNLGGASALLVHVDDEARPARRIRSLAVFSTPSTGFTGTALKALFDYCCAGYSCWRDDIRGKSMEGNPSKIAEPSEDRDCYR